MSDAILYLDRSVIRSPDVEGLRHAVTSLTQFVREREPLLLFYGFEIDEPNRSMRVVAVHPDSTSLATHLEIGGPEFRKVGAFIDLQEIDVFGRPDAVVLEQLQQKAAMLGEAARVSVHEFAAAFDRLASLRA